VSAPEAPQKDPSGGAADRKRRLPVLPASELPPEDEDRPPWHWAVIATIGAFVFWLPLLLLVNAVAMGQSTAWGLLHAGAFALANVGAGLLVGRFGGKAGEREAMVGGASAGALAWVAAVTQGQGGGAIGWALVLAALLALGGAAARGGSALGLRLRSGAAGPR
jgi:hypothetical protein